MDRNQKLLHNLKLSGKGLEIGPLCWPVLTKDRADVKYVDHVSRQELLEIYKNDEAVDPDRIPKVDFPLNGRSLRESIPGNKQFDYIIASHVIEHVPDMVRWLQDMASVLSTGGILSLAIPDKRYTFDIDRQTSTPADVIGAYFDKLTSPSAAMVYDFASNFRTKLNASKVWEGELYLDARAPHKHSATGAYELCLQNQERYVDTHCYVFTPASFFKLIHSLIELELFDYEVDSFYETAEGAYEFIATLKKTKKATSMARKLASIPQLEADPYDRQLEAIIKEQAATIASLSNSVATVQDELTHVLTSKSWKLTRPVRHSIRLAKKVPRKIVRKLNRS